MKNSFRGALFALILAVAFLAPGKAQADVPTTLYIQGPGGSVLANAPLTVPESCTVAGKDFTGHRAPCALQAAKDAGVISDFGFIDFGGSLGLFLDSVNGIATAPDWSESWQLFKNGASSGVGIEQIGLSNCDAFQLTYGPWPTAIAQEALACQISGSPANFSVVLQSLDSGKAVEFLVENQEDDGSFGDPLFTDWVALAFGSSSPQHPAAEKLREYLKANPDPGASLGHPVLSFERRAMALLALGMSPYDAASVDYVRSVASAFDGSQLGSSSLVNDDIFGLLVLLKSGYGTEDDIVSSVIDFITEQQREDGSWGGVDMTAAAVQTLSLVPSAPGVPEALAQAKEYLKDQQEEDGGFGNADSTSWAMQAMAALGEFPWDKGGKTPPAFLASLQESDGGIEGANLESRIWSTAYSIPASFWKPWGAVLAQFEKPAGQEEQAQTDSALERVVLPADGETGGKLVVYEITSVRVAGEGTWDGVIEYLPARTLEDAVFLGQELASLEPVGFAEVNVGEGLSLELRAPATLSVPVFAEEEETLHVYVNSEVTQGEFAYLDSCIVAQGLCTVETAHFSTFAVVRKDKAELAAQEALKQTALRNLEGEVEALRLEVAALRQELALVRQERQLALQQSESTETAVQEEEPSAGAQEESSAGGERQGEATASAAAAVAPRFFSSFGLSQALVLFGMGLLLFLALGGWKLIASLKRRPSLLLEQRPPGGYTGGYEPGESPPYRPNLENQPET